MSKKPALTVITPASSERDAFEDVLAELSAEYASLVSISAAMDAVAVLDSDELGANARLALHRTLRRLEGVRDQLDGAIAGRVGEQS